ncbi:HlyD family secretion protein, partial [Caballeronia terrestris]|uniref:HlyD family secretion protein n=1 Tax=Caballeronia terrestris TaxID=1226301 RepID=UPI000AAA405A
AQGQRVQVRIDAVPGHTFVGRIDSFSPASGAHFALLPPDNATGNFTKIVQRVPVKIVLDPESVGAFKDQLMPGMSALVEIDLRQMQGAAGVRTAKSPSERQVPHAQSQGTVLAAHPAARLSAATSAPPTAPVMATRTETADEMEKRVLATGWSRPASASAARPATVAARKPQKAETADEMEKRVLERGWSRQHGASAGLAPEPSRAAARPQTGRRGYVRT